MQQGVVKFDNEALQMQQGVVEPDDGLLQMQQGVVELDNGLLQMQWGVVQFNKRSLQMQRGVVELDNGLLQMQQAAVKLDNRLLQMQRAIVWAGKGARAAAGHKKYTRRASVFKTTFAARFSGSGWESNPPGPALRNPSNGFEDRGAHQDSTAPMH